MPITNVVTTTQVNSSSAQNEQVRQMNEMMENLKKAIEERDNEIEHLKRIIEERDNEIMPLKMELSIKNERIQYIEQQMSKMIYPENTEFMKLKLEKIKEIILS